MRFRDTLPGWAKNLILIQPLIMVVLGLAIVHGGCIKHREPNQQAKTTAYVEKQVGAVGLIDTTTARADLFQDDKFIVLDVPIENIPKTGIGRIMIKRLSDDRVFSAFIRLPSPFATGATVSVLPVYYRAGSTSTLNFSVFVEVER
jgi:hypothetical protein